MRFHFISILLLFNKIHVSYGVELMKIISKGLLSLYDGGINQEESNKQKMMVIGAGFGRTGTESLCAAFTRLGFNTYHGSKALLYGHLPKWNEWYEKGNNKNIEWNDDDENEMKLNQYDEIFEMLQLEGFNATTDFPASLSYAKFLEINPYAKVVLSVHPKGSDGWATSFTNTLVTLEEIVREPPFSYLRPFKQYCQTTENVRQVIGLKHDHNSRPSHENLKEVYEKWIDHIVKSVPKSQLLIHKATDGYEPLIEFLNIQNPPIDIVTGDLEEYPKVNDTADLYRQIKILGFIGKWWKVIRFFLFLIMIYIAKFIKYLLRKLITPQPMKNKKN